MILSSQITSERGKPVQKTGNMSIVNMIKVGEFGSPDDTYEILVTPQSLSLYHNGHHEITIHNNYNSKSKRIAQ